MWLWTVPWCVKAASCWLIVKIFRKCVCRLQKETLMSWADVVAWSWRKKQRKRCWRGQDEERQRKFWVIFILAWFDSTVSGPGIPDSWLAGPRWQLVAASVRSAAWTTTKLSERVRHTWRERERDGGGEQQTDVISGRNQKRWAGNSLHNEARKRKDERLWLE